LKAASTDSSTKLIRIWTVIPSDESAVISVPFKIFLTASLIPILCDGVIRPTLGLMLIVLK